MPTAIVRRADRQDAGLLAALGERAFCEAFADQTDPADLASYLRSAFAVDDITAQLEDESTLYFIADAQQKAVGYACLSPTRPPDYVSKDAPIQLIRFYLLKKFYGSGAGNRLMQVCLNQSRARGYRTIWLSSWELNARANAFYRRWQFEVVGRQIFTVGSDIQNDFIFQRSL